MAPSAVWEYFKKLAGGNRVECNLCKKELAFCGSTTTLITHVRKVHNKHVAKNPPSGQLGGQSKRLRLDGGAVQNNADDPATPSTSKGTASTVEGGTATATSTGPLEKCLERAGSFTSGGFRDRDCTLALMFMVVRDNMPLSTPEREGFRTFTKHLQPLYKPPTEATLTSLLEDKYVEMKAKIGKEISEANFVTLTTDIWTHESTMNSYIGVTVHYLVGTILRSVEIETKQLTDRKRIPYLREVLRTICEEWQINYDKINGVVTDGGANIKGAVKEEFGTSKHISCFAHLLNGVGQRAITINNLPEGDEPAPRAQPVSDIDDDDELGLEEEESNNSRPISSVLLRRKLLQVKRIVRYFRQSEVATAELKNLQRVELGKEPNQCLKLIQEVRTRWNSCYDMLDRFIYLSQEDIISRVLRKMAREKSSKSKPPTPLLDSDLDELTEVRDLLKPLATATKEICGDENVTLSKIIPLVNGLLDKTAKFQATTPIGFNLKASLQADLEAQFGMVKDSKLFGAATLLDPRFKKHGFNDARTLANAISHVGALVKDHINLRDQAVPVSSAGAERPQRRSDTEDDLWADLDRAVKLSREAAASQLDEAAGGTPMELLQYLNQPAADRRVHRNPFVPLEDVRYACPNVYQVALKYLSVLATSVPAERLFSHAGLILTQQRNRLSAEHVRQLVFLRSVEKTVWFDGK